MQNLEIKNLTEEKKDALAAQYAAEAALSRVHADQKEDDFFPIESVIAPLEAEVKMYRTEVLIMQFQIITQCLCIVHDDNTNIHFVFRLYHYKKITKL